MKYLQRYNSFFCKKGVSSFSAKTSKLLFLSTIIFMVLSFCFFSSSCSDRKKMTSSIVKNEIVATLRGKVKPQQVVAAFQKYRMETVKVVDKNTNIWMFSFDEKLIDPDQFLSSLQDSQFIKSAKFSEKAKPK